MNFDNPVYRKTTEEQFVLEKSEESVTSYPSVKHSISNYLSLTFIFLFLQSMEPLTSPGTNEFV